MNILQFIESLGLSINIARKLKDVSNDIANTKVLISNSQPCICYAACQGTIIVPIPYLTNINKISLSFDLNNNSDSGFFNDSLFDFDENNKDIKLERRTNKRIIKKIRILVKDLENGSFNRYYQDLNDSYLKETHNTWGHRTQSVLLGA